MSGPPVPRPSPGRASRRACCRRRSPRPQRSIYYALRRGAAATPPRKPLTQGDRHRLYTGLHLVVGVLAVVAVQVKGEATVLGKGAQELGEELYIEGAYLLGHESQVAGEMTTSPEVHDGGREGLYKGS